MEWSRHDGLGGDVTIKAKAGEFTFVVKCPPVWAGELVPGRAWFWLIKLDQLVLMAGQDEASCEDAQKRVVAVARCLARGLLDALPEDEA